MRIRRLSTDRIVRDFKPRQPTSPPRILGGQGRTPSEYHETLRSARWWSVLVVLAYVLAAIAALPELAG